MAFDVNTEHDGEIAVITVGGELDASSAGSFRDAVELAATASPQRVVLVMDRLTFMASAGLRVLVFAKQKMGSGVDLFVVGAHDAVLETIQMTGFHHSVIMLDSYDASAIRNY